MNCSTKQLHKTLTEIILKIELLHKEKQLQRGNSNRDYTENRTPQDAPQRENSNKGNLTKQSDYSQTDLHLRVKWLHKSRNQGEFF
jgi:hypothetical protein